MSSELEEKIDQHREALETVANADCSASWIAQRLLQATEGHSSYSSQESNEKAHTPTVEPQNQSQEGVKDSVFAY